MHGLLSGKLVSLLDNCGCCGANKACFRTRIRSIMTACHKLILSWILDWITFLLSSKVSRLSWKSMFENNVSFLRMRLHSSMTISSRLCWRNAGKANATNKHRKKNTRIHFHNPTLNFRLKQGEVSLMKTFVKTSQTKHNLLSNMSLWASRFNHCRPLPELPRTNFS